MAKMSFLRSNNFLSSKVNRFLSFCINLKIENKLFLVFTTMLIVFSLACFGIVEYTLNLYRDRLYGELNNALNISKGNIEDVMSHAEELSLCIISDNSIQQDLKIMQTEANVYQNYLAMERMQNKILEYLHMPGVSNISSIIFVDTKNNQYAMGSQTIYLDEETLKKICDMATDEEGAIVWTKDSEESEYALCVQHIRSTENLELSDLGTLILKVDMKSAITSVTRYFSTLSSSFYMLRDQKIWFQTGGSSPEIDKLGIPDSKGYQFQTIDGVDTMMCFDSSIKKNFSVVVALPYKSTFSDYLGLKKIIILFIFILLGIMILVNKLISRNLSYPINYLAKQMEQVGDGDFDQFTRDFKLEQRKDEVGKLYHSLTYMLYKIQVLIQENYSKQLLLTQTELEALQAQINPHFLYNTLESIRLLSITGNGKMVAAMTEALGRIMRSNLNKSGYMHSLSSELSLLEDYLFIQKTRYEDRLYPIIHTEKEVNHFLVPRFTLQPLVENSIKYGLEARQGTCHIFIDCRRSGQEILTISIQDDGPGIPRDKIPDILSGIYHSDSTGIGIYNIRRRIQALYGPPFDLFITNHADGGTIITIHLPCMDAEKEEDSILV